MSNNFLPQTGILGPGCVIVPPVTFFVAPQWGLRPSGPA